MTDYHSWWDIVDYSGDEYPLPTFTVEAPEKFTNPVGFVDFRFRGVKDQDAQNRSKRRCAISKVKLK